MSFEIKKSDASARIGKLDSIETPIILQHDEIRRFLSERNVEIPEIITPFSIPPPERINLSEPLVHPKRIEEKDLDFLVLCASSHMETRGRELFETMEKLKSKLKPDTAIYLPALATPENLSILVFLGADIFDDLRCMSAAMSGEYLTRDGSFRISELDSLPCSCPICSTHTSEELRSNWRLIYLHNLNALLQELQLIKIFLKKGTLREYISKQSKSSPWLTVAIRLYDRSEYYQRRVPIRRTSKFYANSSDDLHRAEVKRFASRILERYTPKSKILLLLPCSATKPYSLSPSHQKVIKALGALRRCVDEAIITSPLGVVPRYLETVYPAMHYDVPVTGYWDEEEKKWASSLLRDFVERHRYERVLAYVEGGYLEVCRLSEIEIEYFESPEELRKELESEDREIPSQRRYLVNQVSSVADYQFGRGAGERLTENSQVRGRYPRLEILSNGRKLASIGKDGMLTLSISGAERLRGLSDYTVRIEEFIPSGSILSPGIVEAGKEILAGDEVLFENSMVFGVGRAMMCSEDMVRSSYGVAVNVRAKVVKE